MTIYPNGTIVRRSGVDRTHPDIKITIEGPITDGRLGPYSLATYERDLVSETGWEVIKPVEPANPGAVVAAYDKLALRDVYWVRSGRYWLRIEDCQRQHWDNLPGTIRVVFEGEDRG